MNYLEVHKKWCNKICVIWKALNVDVYGLQKSIFLLKGWIEL